MRDYYYVVEFVELFYQGHHCIVKLSRHDTLSEGLKEKEGNCVLSGDEIFKAGYIILERKG